MLFLQIVKMITSDGIIVTLRRARFNEEEGESGRGGKMRPQN
jgi:hypothetical protein